MFLRKCNNYKHIFYWCFRSYPSCGCTKQNHCWNMWTLAWFCYCELWIHLSQEKVFCIQCFLSRQGHILDLNICSYDKYLFLPILLCLQDECWFLWNTCLQMEQLNSHNWSHVYCHLKFKIFTVYEKLFRECCRMIPKHRI